MKNPREQARQFKLLFGWILGPLLLVGGVSYHFSVRKDLQTAHEASLWPTTPGTILASELKTESRYSNRRRYTSCRPEVEYEYVVASVTHRGRRISFAPQDRGDCEFLKSLTAKYTVGNVVPVSYDPRKPTEAYLEASALGGLHLRYKLSVALIVAGLLCMATLLLRDTFLDDLGES